MSLIPRPPAYNPYPPGILPADLDSEIRRVRGEVRFVFQRYLTQWKALPPPTTTGNPPTLGGTGYDAIRILGGLLNYDGKMSPFKNEACAFCHMPYGGFSGPIPSINLTIIAYPGTFHFRAGKRTAQRYTYSPRFPVLHLNRAKRAGVGGTFTGGNFWDARSTGYKLQSLTQSRHSIRRSIRRRWASPIPLASHSGFRRLCTDPCLRRFGAPVHWI
jgi:hypothetical protein